MTTHDGSANYVGRLWDREQNGPILVLIKNKEIYDITHYSCATISELMEKENIHEFLSTIEKKYISNVENIYYKERGIASDKYKILAPIDLQAIKACGVTFANSMLERVIEERANGDKENASEVRFQIIKDIGRNIDKIKPGSKEAKEIKKELQKIGYWSQYLEVGLGEDAEVFTKSQVLSAVGSDEEIGIHEKSSWNNPEPEIVLIVNSEGIIKGATLGNDVNLRDVEGRSALLLGKAKDNNASCAIGPYIRLFDDNYGIQDVKKSEVYLEITGNDGFVLSDKSSMAQISRNPEELVDQVYGKHHQYPDGFALFLGTLFSPTKDRDENGMGFTHKIGDKVTISNAQLGRLTNYVNLSNHCKPWKFGIRDLMKNLSKRKLI